MIALVKKGVILCLESDLLLSILTYQDIMRPHVDVEASWTQVSDLAQQLLERRFGGKAVLHVSN